jgi:hypothetical protein
MAVNGAISRVERCHGSLFFHRFGGHDASHSDPQFIVPLITYAVERPNPLHAYPQVEEAEGCDVESFIAL